MTGPLKVAKFSQDSVQSSLERVRISWNLAEASRQCCLYSLSFTPLPRVQMAYGTLHLSSIQKVLGSNPSWIPDFFLWIYFSHSH